LLRFPELFASLTNGGEEHKEDSIMLEFQLRINLREVLLVVVLLLS